MKYFLYCIILLLAGCSSSTRSQYDYEAEGFRIKSMDGITIEEYDTSFGSLTTDCVVVLSDGLEIVLQTLDGDAHAADLVTGRSGELSEVQFGAFDQMYTKKANLGGVDLVICGRSSGRIILGMLYGQYWSDELFEKLERVFSEIEIIPGE